MNLKTRRRIILLMAAGAGVEQIILLYLKLHYDSVLTLSWPIVFLAPALTFSLLLLGCWLSGSQFAVRWNCWFMSKFASLGRTSPAWPLIERAARAGWLKDQDDFAKLRDHLQRRADFIVDELRFEFIAGNLRVSFLTDTVTVEPSVLVKELTACC